MMNTARWIFMAVAVCLCAGCGKPEPMRSGGRTASAWAEVLQPPHADVALRRKAAAKLGPLILLDDAALPALVEALHDKDSLVRASAARSLGIYSGPKGPVVLPALEEAQRQERDRKAREAISTAIARLVNDA
jgi:HEAT repeat protein